MLSLLLFANTLLFALRLSGGGSFPKPLSAEEEQIWLERFAHGDAEARNVLIEHNLRLVAHIIKKYYTQSADQEDLISIGTIGLIKGISSFDASRGARLATYAARCIENEILMYFRGQKKLQNEVSLSDSIESDSGEDALQLLDVVGTEDTMLDEIQNREDAVRVRQLVGQCLPERESRIIRLRYGLDGSVPLTQREVAAVFGISRSYVSRRGYCKRSFIIYSTLSYFCQRLMLYSDTGALRWFVSERKTVPSAAGLLYIAIPSEEWYGRKSA